MHPQEAAAGQCLVGADRYYADKIAQSHAPTLGQNIDRRIAMMEQQIEQLKRVKAQIAEGNWLEVSMDDLRQAMNY